MPFAPALRARYPDAPRATCVVDSRRFPDPASAIDRALEAAGWPSAAEVIARPVDGAGD